MFLRLGLLGFGAFCVYLTAKELFPGRMNPNSLFSEVFDKLRVHDEVSFTALWRHSNDSVTLCRCVRSWPLLVTTKEHSVVMLEETPRVDETTSIHSNIRQMMEPIACVSAWISKEAQEKSVFGLRYVCTTLDQLYLWSNRVFHRFKTDQTTTNMCILFFKIPRMVASSQSLIAATKLRPV